MPTKIALAEVPILFIYVRGREYEVGIYSRTALTAMLPG
jgi:hypothetical protein